MDEHGVGGAFLDETTPGEVDEDPTGFRVVWTDDGGERRVWAAGEIDLLSAAQFEQALAPTCDKLTVDLSSVTFMDLAGLRSLVRAARKSHVRLVTSPVVRRLLEVTATGALFEHGTEKRKNS